MSAKPQPSRTTIYNPHSQSRQALIDGFVVRKQKFERLFRDIRDSPMTKPEQHYLIQGLRGMGKTTLLLRIAYEIDNTSDLRQRLIPVLFNEEEYGIASLADIWERTASYLSESDSAFTGLEDSMAKDYGQPDYEALAFQKLIDALQQQDKKIVLLIDNIGDILKKLDAREEKRLREILLTRPEIRIIGASSEVIEQIHDYTKPFYEFFKVIHLEGLNRQEALDLFRMLGVSYQRDTIRQLVEHKPGRIEAIRRLTGGVIRTMVLFFEILVEENSGSVFQDLNQLLDRVTPLYKHRLDDLAAQQQKIVAALAQAWDAASTKELAAAVRLESKVVSAQLKQLVSSGLVAKVETHTKNHLYRLEERFFNIWYLMRFGRKNDQRVLWLVRFFETMFAGNPDWMQERLNHHLAAMERRSISPQVALYLTDAFRKVLANDDFERYRLLEKTQGYVQENEPRLLKEANYDELGDRSLWEEALSKISSVNGNADYAGALISLEKLQHPSGYAYYYQGVCHTRLQQYDRAKDMFTKSSSLNYADADYWLGTLALEIDKDLYSARRYFLQAVDRGDTTSLIQLGIIKKLSRRYKDAFAYFDRAIRSGEFGAINEAASLALERKEYPLFSQYSRLSSLVSIYTHSLPEGPYLDGYSLFTRFFYNLFHRKDSTQIQTYLSQIDDVPLEPELKRLLLNILAAWSNRFETLQPQTFAFLAEQRIRVTENTLLTQDKIAQRRKNIAYDNDALWLSSLVNLYIELLLAKKQYHTAYNYFQQDDKLLSDQLKPIYYVTGYYLKDEYPTEYLRMGPELEETVKDILDDVAQIAVDYA